MPNVSQYEKLKFRFSVLRRRFSVLRQILWPERKAWTYALIGAVLGTFTNLANALLRVIPPLWLLLGFGTGCVSIYWCGRRVAKVLKEFNDDRTKEDKLDSGVQCAPCALFRLCFFSFCVVFVLSMTSAGQLSTDAIAQTLRSMNIKLEGISSGVARVDSKLDRVKLETSEDPRKELANRGVLWTTDAFFDAIRRGDDSTVKLFIAGRMTTDSPDSQGRPLPVILALNTSNAPAMLGLLVSAGLDVNHSYEVAGALARQRMTLLSRAIEKGSAALAAALIKSHVDVNSPIQTFGAMGLTRDTYPLASAIYWRQLEIAQLLIDAGADPALGDYAAYREALALREKTSDSQMSAQLNVLVSRLAPHGTVGARIDAELRLQAIEQRLNQVARTSLSAPRDAAERRRLDGEYQRLQIERTQLRNQLHLAAK